MGENFVIKLFAEAPADWKIAADLPPKDEGTIVRLFQRKEIVVSYFAYKRDMTEDTLRDMLGWRELSESQFTAAVAPKVTVLEGYEIVFNMFDPTSLAGLPNIRPKPGNRWRGALYTAEICG